MTSSSTAFRIALDDEQAKSEELWNCQDMAWVTPQFNRTRVDAAGEALINTPLGSHERDDVLVIVNNWRASHSYPLLVVKMTLLNRAKKVDSKVLVAQRLKRLSSVEAKLRRFDDMQLSRMHDIGGCRAVLRSVQGVRRLVRVYAQSIAKNPNARCEFVREYDYIENPKADGYRSVHLVYKYRSASRKHEVFNGLRIEIQLRSQLQHAWATAVETADMFTGQALKSNVGHESWKRFFALMGSALAHRERCPLVPGTPNDITELTRELRELSRNLKVATVLRGWGSAVQVTERVPGAAAFLLVLDLKARRIRVRGFGKTELPKASDEYLAAEKEIAGNPDMQAVLVSVDSLLALRKAYPNYYLDTSNFIEALARATMD